MKNSYCNAVARIERFCISIAPIFVSRNTSARVLQRTVRCYAVSQYSIRVHCTKHYCSNEKQNGFDDKSYKQFFLLHMHFEKRSFFTLLQNDTEHVGVFFRYYNNRTIKNRLFMPDVASLSFLGTSTKEREGSVIDSRFF